MNQLQVHVFSLPKPMNSLAVVTDVVVLPLLPLRQPRFFPSPKNRFAFRFPISCVSYSRQHRTVNMDAELKRSVCPKCSKPTRVCFCTRFKLPPVENSVAVTILQHTLEKKHPLNSARIASLGIRNVNVVSVSDVNSQACFAVRPLGSDEETGSSCLGEDSSGAFGISKRKWDSLAGSTSCSGLVESSDFSGFSECSGQKFLVNLDEVFSGSAESHHATEDDVFGFTVEKFGAISSVTMNGIPEDQSALSAICSRRGFSVSKFQRKQLDGNADNEEFQEFEIEVSPGSVLLYPSENAVGIEALDIKVTNVIVLDATWAKARRMYSENPWLKRLPHLRLDMADASLYREVRQQPKAGCLSTIESIVYALKALGEDSANLDGLLEVFKSMVGDQRRCKDERLSQVSAKPPN